jgi:hypothetical protein
MYLSIVFVLNMDSLIFLFNSEFISLFARLISHQPAVLFSQNEPATSNQPQPASSTLLSEQTSTSHQPPANRTGCMYYWSNLYLHIFIKSNGVYSSLFLINVGISSPSRQTW